MPHRIRSCVPSEILIFGGVYGSVLACALAAALDADSGAPDPGYDALWVLLTALASAAAHGYARAIANHQPAGGEGMAASAVRSVLGEWALPAATMPTVLMLLASYAGWWAEDTAVTAALAFNTVALFCWGLWAARTIGRRSWPAACWVGAGDMTIGLFIAAVNALIK
jgi:cobalamin synthase